MDILCTADMCPVILNSTCVFYEGNTLTYTGITTNDSLQTALQKIDAKFGDAMVGYIFTDGVYQSVAGAPVGLGGSLTQNITIGGNFTLTFAGNVKAAKHVTTGGTSSQFVKGDGTLDSTSYQVAGNYITNLTGDVLANGPGSVAATLATVNSNPGTYGSGSLIPVVTVDTKGRVTALTTTAIAVPSGILSFVGDVYGSGTTGSPTTLTLSTVNSNVYAVNTFLKFKVNAKGLVTGAAPITHVDIEGVLGYVPVPETRTISINGVVRDLQTNAVFVLPGGGSVTNVSATAGTGISVSVTDPTTTPNITITNTAPDQVVSIAAGTGINVTGTYPNFTVAATNTGSVTDVTASAPLASSGGTTPNITISQASTSTDGYLSSTDWNTFNSKQAAGSYITALTGEATASGPGSAAVTLSTPAVTSKLLTGVNITGGSIAATDSILEAFGKVQNQINGLIGGSIYKGTWDASTNTPTITSGVGTTGWYYIVSVPGSTTIDGISDWNLGDWIIFDGTAWQQVDNTDAVVSVNGYTGAVSLVSSDIPEGLTNLYYTPARARTAISITTTGTSGASTYDNITGVLNIPNYTTDLSGYVPNTRTLTINGTSYDLSADRSWTVAGSMPTGGLAGQILAKIDGTDYNTEWIDNFATQVKNEVKLGAALTKGTPVYVSSANGTNMIVSASSNTTEATSSKTFGLLETGGALNDLVKCVTYGLLAGLNTSAANAAGDPVWLGPNGTLLYGLANKPYAPAHMVYIGVVTRVNTNNGEIFINVQNGFEMDELHNVSAQNPANNAILAYSTATSLWEKNTIAGVLGYTPANGANYVPYTGATGPVNLGAYDLTVNQMTVGNGGNDESVILGKFVTLTGLSATAVGYGTTAAVNSVTIGRGAQGTQNSVAIGYGSNIYHYGVGVGRNTRSGSYSVAIGYLAGNAPNYNISIGYNAGSTINNGSYNTLVGGYTGTSTMNSNVILSDGQGNIRFQWDGSNIKLNGNTVGSNAYTSTPFLPLAGGTMTGALVINPANSAIVGLDVASNTFRLRTDSSQPFNRQLTTTLGSGTLVKMQAAGYGATYVTDLGFYTSSSSAVNTTPNLYLTGGNNYVGVNTDAPAYALDVVGDVNVTGTFRVNGTPLSGGGVTSFNTRTGAITLTSTDVTTALGYTPVTDARTLTINGTTYDLTANRSWTVGASSSARNEETFTATAGTNTLTVTGGYTVGLIDVYVNGVKYLPSDFTATTSPTVIITGLVAGDTIDIITYNSTVGNIAGSGTANYIPKFTASGTVGNSAIQDNGSTITLGRPLLGTTATFTGGIVAINHLDATLILNRTETASGGAAVGFATDSIYQWVLGLKSNVNENLYLYNPTGIDYVIFNAVTGGATFNYPLAGTSATFSSSVTASGKILTNTTYSTYGQLIVQANTTATYGGANIYATDASSFISVSHTGSKAVIGSDYGVSGGAYAPLSLQTSNTDRLYITTAGNVGIGTTSPDSGLNINSAATRGLRIDTNSGVQGFSMSPNSVFGIDEPGVGNGRFIINTNGRVGIGTASPSYPLHVVIGSTSADANNTNTGSTANLYNYFVRQKGASNGISGIQYMLQTFSDAGANGMEIYTQGASSTLVFGTAATERMRITSGGNVGIGTTSPGFALDVHSGSAGSIINLNTTRIGGGGFAIANNGSARLYLGNANWMGISGESTSSTAISLSAAENSAIIFARNAANSVAESMRITSGGHVLVGVTSSIWAGDSTRGIVHLNGSTNAIYGITIGGTNAGYLYHSGSNLALNQTKASAAFTITNEANSYMSFGTNSTERMRITSGGNLLVGTTTDAGEKLRVNGNLRALSLYASDAGLSADNWIRLGHDDNVGFINVNRAVNSGDFHFRFDGTTRATINRSTGVYVATSDINKKKDLEESKIGLTEVMQLKPTLYRMKTDDSKGIKELGFIAQEVKEIIPNAYVENGDFIGLNFNPIVAALTKAVQDLKAELDTLKNK